MSSTPLSADRPVTPGSSDGHSSDGFSRALSRRICSLHDQDLRPETETRARHSLLDWLGTGLIGSTEPVARIVREAVSADGGVATSSIIGIASKGSPQQAALANGTAVHAIDFDDSYPEAHTHVTACVASAAFAVAELLDASGSELLVAIVAGFEALHMLGAAIGLSHYERGFHNTGTLGSIGAAAAAGYLLDLDEDQMSIALSLAAAQASGLKATFGTMGKPFAAGRAAANGLFSAQLAGRGFVVPGDVIERPLGLAFTHGGGFDAARARFDDELGSGIVGNIFKYHACCHGTHSTLEGVRQIVETHDPRLDALDRITLEVSDIAPDVCAIAAPVTGLEGKFSLAHVASLAVTGHDTGPAGFTDAVVNDPGLRALREKVSVHPVSGRTMFCSRVVMQLDTGDELVAEVDVQVPTPDGELPRQERALSTKFRALASTVLPRQRVDELATMILQSAPLASAPAIGDLVAA